MKVRTRMLAALVWLFASGPADAQETPTIDDAVTDLADVLTDVDADTIRQRLVAQHEATGVQLAVLVIPTTGGEPIEDYALRVATRWRGGSEARDDGALFVLAVQDRRMRLEVGYGLEAAIPDARASRVIRRAIPSLRQQEYGRAVTSVIDGFEEAIAAGPEVASSAAAPVTTPRAFHSHRRAWHVPATKGAVPWWMLFLLGSVLGAVMRRRAKRRQTEAHAEDRTNGLDIAALAVGMSVVAMAGLAGWHLELGWFPLAGTASGMIAGRVFLWSEGFKSFHYLLLATVVSVVLFFLLGGLLEEPDLGLGVATAAQIFLTMLYGNVSNGGSRPGFFDFLVVDDGYSGSSSSFSSSSTSFSSRSGSSGSSGSSGGYSGGGGGFGGGGASASW